MKKIQILGSGCPKCGKLAENAESAAAAAGIEYEIEKVTDLNRMMEMGVFITPAVAVDGELKVAGRVPSVEEIKEMLA